MAKYKDKDVRIENPYPPEEAEKPNPPPPPPRKKG